MIPTFNCSLKGCQELWQKRLDALPGIETLMANCVVTAAINVYCGPLQTLTRSKFFDGLQRICQSQGFTTNKKHNLLKLEDFPEFMLGTVRH